MHHLLPTDCITLRSIELARRRNAARERGIAVAAGNLSNCATLIWKSLRSAMHVYVLL